MRTAPIHPVRKQLVVLGLVALSLGACDFPTEPPIIESRFVIPAEQTTLRINQLLPSDVTVAGNDFALNVQGSSFSQSLAQMCGAPCIAAHGLLVPKPAFADTIPVVVDLAADVQSAVLTSGAVNVSLQHNFGFDPLRPAGAATNGSMTITIRSGGAVIGTLAVTDPFPSGTALARTVPLTANATVTSPITVDVGIISPLGVTPVQMNSNAQLNVTATPASIRISQANVRVPSTNVNVEQVSLDLTDVDTELGDRIQSGALVVRLTNPFNAGGTMTLTIGGANVQPKQVVVAPCATATPCTTTQNVQFTKSEMQAMVGRQVTFAISGRLTSGSGFVTVKPTQQIGIDTQLDLVLRVGGDEN